MIAPIPPPKIIFPNMPAPGREIAVPSARSSLVGDSHRMFKFFPDLRTTTYRPDSTEYVPLSFVRSHLASLTATPCSSSASTRTICVESVVIEAHPVARTATPAAITERIILSSSCLQEETFYPCVNLYHLQSFPQ